MNGRIVVGYNDEIIFSDFGEISFGSDRFYPSLSSQNTTSTRRSRVQRRKASLVVDQYKDYAEPFRTYIYAQREGKSEEEVKQIHDRKYVPTKNKFLEAIERILKDNGSGYLVGDGLTWADLVVADHLYSLSNIKELDEVLHKNLKEYQERIYSLPELKDHIETRPKSEM